MDKIFLQISLQRNFLNFFYIFLVNINFKNIIIKLNYMFFIFLTYLLNFV